MPIARGNKLLMRIAQPFCLIEVQLLTVAIVKNGVFHTASAHQITTAFSSERDKSALGPESVSTGDLKLKIIETSH